MELQIYMMPAITQALGPFRRCALWVQGCMKQCPGCISPDAQPLDGGIAVSVDELAKQIDQLSDIEGITISGGEPFLQQDALCDLIDTVRNQKNLGVIVYTGMQYEEIKDTQLAKRCDLIIDGEYIGELNDDLSLRGSSNQRVICCTDRYVDIVGQHYGRPGRKMEFILKNGSMAMVGIPSKKIGQAIKLLGRL